MNFSKPVQDELLLQGKEKPEAVLSRLGTVLQGAGFSILRNENSLIGTKGSKALTRVLGGFFVSTHRLPIRIEIEATETSVGASVRVRFSDNLGWGWRDGLEEVYLPYFKKLSEELSRRASLIVSEESRDRTQTPKSYRKRLRAIVVLGVLILCAVFFVDVLETVIRIAVRFLRAP